jgi:hypothetical protein
MTLPNTSLKEDLSIDPILTTVNYREIPPVKLTSSGKLTEIAG